MDAEYNDILEWNHAALLDVFNGGQNCNKFTAKTRDELERLLNDEAFNSAQKLQLVEIHMPKKDAPRALVMTAKSSQQVG